VREPVDAGLLGFFCAISLEAEELAIPEAVGAAKGIKEAEPMVFTPRLFVQIREFLETTLQREFAHY
jgi:hypothetical protein